MATLIKIDGRSKEAKLFIEFVKTLPFVQIEEPKRYNAETEKTIIDAKKGIGIKKAKNAKELFKNLGI